MKKRFSDRLSHRFLVILLIAVMLAGAIPSQGLLSYAAEDGLADSDTNGTATIAQTDSQNDQPTQTDLDDDPENPKNRGLTDKETPAGVADVTAGSSSGTTTGQSSSYLKGIDVSYWNDTIDWKKVKAAGVKFAIIRVGYATMLDGALHEDYMYDENIIGAYKAGIKVGVYIYSQAATKSEARAEAAYVIKKIEPYRDYISLPVVMDMESPLTYNGIKTHWARANVSEAQAAANYLAFADTVNKAGYVPMFYTYTSWIAEHVGSSMSKIQASGYPFWLAEYTSATKTKPPLFTKLYGSVYKYDFWQYSDSGRVDGVSSYVDLNRWYTSDISKYQKLTSVYRGIQIEEAKTPVPVRLVGQPFSIKGTITSKAMPLKRVQVGVISKETGKWVDGFLFDERGLETDSFDIAQAGKKVRLAGLPAGEYYYRVNAYAENGTKRRLINQEITVKKVIVTNIRKPGTLKQGKNFTIRGKVRTAVPTKRVEIGVVNKKTGKWVRKIKYNETGLDTSVIHIHDANSTVDFSKLDAGKYYYRIVIHPVKGNARTIVNKSFTVKPVFKLKNYTAPKKIKKGHGFELKGRITCSTKIKRVKVGVVSKKTGEWVKGVKYTVNNVNAKSFRISRVDEKIRFGKLPKGTYYYRIWVYTESGTKRRLLNKKFIVK